MKKLLLVFTAVLAIPFVSLAQKGWQVGLKSIPFFSMINNQTDSDTSKEGYEFVISGGYSFGVAGGYNFNDHIGVQLNVLYSNQGQTNKTTYIGTDSLTVRYTRRVSYLKLPLMLRLNTNPERKVIYSALIGPQLDILLDAKHKNNDPRYQPKMEDNPNIYGYPKTKDLYYDTNFSAVLALGVDVKLKYNWHLNAHLRLDYTFNDIENKDAHYYEVQNGTAYKNYYYNQNRAKSNFATAGLMIGLTHTFLPY